MKKIIVVGSCNTDMVIKSDRLPIPGETILGGTFFMNPGGKGANQAATIARMGGHVTFITKAGNDIFGKQSIELYNSEGINTDYIFSDPELPSGVALITIDNHGENCIVVASGANANLKPKDVEVCRKEFDDAEILLMQLEIPLETVEYAAQLAQEKGVKIILNPAPAQSLPVSLIEKLFLITPNKTEAEMLSGIKVTDWDSAVRAANAISEKGVENVVITLGSEGALVKENNEFHKVEAYKVKTVDTTAAGDTFNGTLCVGLAEGLSILESVKFASKASAIAVTRMGAQSSIPFRKELSCFD